jgi:hypothetical protein
LCFLVLLPMDEKNLSSKHHCTAPDGKRVQDEKDWLWRLGFGGVEEEEGRRRSQMHGIGWRLRYRPCPSLRTAKVGKGQLFYGGGVASRTASPRHPPRTYGLRREGRMGTRNDYFALRWRAKPRGEPPRLSPLFSPPTKHHVAMVADHRAL